MSIPQDQLGVSHDWRRSARGLLLLALLAIAALALDAATASAAIRYAAPGAGGGSPCNPAPCGLATAVNGAGDGDQVVLASGTYNTASDLTLGKAIEVGGQPGAAPSIVFSGDHGALVKNSAATLHDVRLSQADETMLYALTDLDGAARSQPRCIGGDPVPDIGAYELTPTDPCPVGPRLLATTSASGR